MKFICVSRWKSHTSERCWSLLRIYEAQSGIYEAKQSGIYEALSGIDEWSVVDDEGDWRTLNLCTYRGGVYKSTDGALFRKVE